MLTSLFRNLLSRSASRKTPFHNAKRKSTCRLAVEMLEDRAVPAGFTFSDFSDPSSLSLLGDAAITPSNVLRLTPAVGGQEGAAWYTADKQFAGLAFEATFQFQLHVNGAAPGEGSDGFAFILQNTAPTFLSGGGGTLGYYGLKNSLAVEFDTYQNSEVGDQSQSSVSVHTNGTGANDWSESLSIGSYNTNPIMDDGAVHTAKIAYTPGTLSIYLDNLTTPKLTVSVDLGEKLNLDAGKAWVGFTAATGGGWQNHDILNWTYAVTPDVTTTVWASDASVIEGNAGTTNLVFTINRAGDTSGTTTVNWTTENRTATAPSDYTADSGQVTFAANETQATVSITVSGDTALEADETLALRLTSASGAAIVDGVGIGTILADDVTVSISDASAIEGDHTAHFRGRFVETIPGVHLANSVMFDGPYFYASPGPSKIAPIDRYDANTGAFVDHFIPARLQLSGIRSPVIRGGFLYVGSEYTDEIQRYDAVTGAPAGVSGIPDDAVFVSAGSGGIDGPHGLCFGPDGNLYVTGRNSFNVIRYDGATGQYLGSLNTSGSGALSWPEGITIDASGVAYVASPGSHQVQKYNTATGAYLGAISNAALTAPKDVKFGPDGLLYVLSTGNSRILRFTAAGAFKDDYVAPGSGGMNNLTRLAFGPDGDLYVSGAYTNNFIYRFGTENEAIFTVTTSTTSSLPVTVGFTTADVSANSGSDYLTTSGTVTIAPGFTSTVIRVPIVDDTNFEPTETFSVTLSNPVGAIITDGLGVATIVDNEPSISISDVTMAEGKKPKTTLFTFTVTLSQAYDQAVTVSYQTVNGTATTANKDYVAQSGTITFLPGETTKTITIEVIGDNTKEANELFYVDLFGNSGNSLITKNRGIGTILNDD